MGSSATFTIAESRMIMSIPVQSTTSAIVRERSVAVIRSASQQVVDVAGHDGLVPAVGTVGRRGVVDCLEAQARSFGGLLAEWLVR